MPLRAISDGVPVIKGNLVSIIIVALHLASLLCGRSRRLSLGGAFLAGALAGAGTLIGPAPLGLRVVLAVVAATNAIIAVRACGVATYLARTTGSCQQIARGESAGVNRYSSL